MRLNDFECSKIQVNFFSIQHYIKKFKRWKWHRQPEYCAHCWSSCWWSIKSWMKQPIHHCELIYIAMCDKRILLILLMHCVDIEYSKRRTLIDREGIAVTQLTLTNNRSQFIAKQQHQLASAHMWFYLFTFNGGTGRFAYGGQLIIWLFVIVYHITVRGTPCALRKHNTHHPYINVTNMPIISFSYFRVFFGSHSPFHHWLHHSLYSINLIGAEV